MQGRTAAIVRLSLCLIKFTVISCEGSREIQSFVLTASALSFSAGTVTLSPCACLGWRVLEHPAAAGAELVGTRGQDGQGGSCRQSPWGQSVPALGSLQSLVLAELWAGGAAGALLSPSRLAGRLCCSSLISDVVLLQLDF